MSVEDVILYFKMLDEDKEFAEAIVNSSVDKTEQMRLINERGLEFSKEEFKTAMTDYLSKNCASADKIKGKVPLSDSELDSVNAAGLFGELLGAFTGSIFAITAGGVLAVGKTLNEIADGKSLDDALSSGTQNFNENANSVIKDTTANLGRMIPF